jgi:hypothetical protein
MRGATASTPPKRKDTQTLILPRITVGLRHLDIPPTTDGADQNVAVDRAHEKKPDAISNPSGNPAAEAQQRGCDLSDEQHDDQKKADAQREAERAVGAAEKLAVRVRMVGEWIGRRAEPRPNGTRRERYYL